jgi:glucokinase
MNDFAAAAWGVGLLAPAERVTLQAGEPVAGAPRVVLGAGTGLGIAYVAAGVEPISGEGGHGAFAPATEEQAALWRYLHERLGRVTLEHVISGAGLARIYAFLRQHAGLTESAELRAALQSADPAATISHHAIERADPLASAALELFTACYGAAAGDHALNVMARGGVFVAGGIAPKILPRLRAGGFIAAFNDKGDFSEYARRMPVHVVTSERLGLIGAAAAAQA